MMFDAIPQELKTYGLWCYWRKDAKDRKIPFNPINDKMAKANDKSTFSTFLIALKNVFRYLEFDKEGRATGGLGLGLFNGFSGIDIDKCRNPETGELTELANDVIEYCDSYTEISPSGTGIRIILKTDTILNRDTHYIKNSNIGLEIYLSEQTNRYVTITGNCIKEKDIRNVDLSYILDKYMIKPIKNVATAFDKILLKDEKLRTLWYGKAPGSGANESELDLGLCSKLAYYMHGNVDLINEKFISSPYFASKDKAHKEKWLVRQDYREQTLSMAIISYQENTQKDLIFDLTDTGNAHRFIERFGENIRYNIEMKRWYIWNGKHWQEDAFNNIKNYAELLAEELKQEALLASGNTDRNNMLRNVARILSSSGKEAMLKEAMHLKDTPITNGMFNQDIFFLNTESGIVDLRNGDILEHKKDYFMSKIVPYEIDKTPPKRWIQFLHEIFEDQPATIDYVHKMFGYSLTASTQEQCIFFLVGDGNNGKSLMTEVISTIMGDYSTTTKPEVFLEKPVTQGNAPSPEIAKLSDIRMSVISETNVGARLNESAVKSYTSGLEKIVARRLYGNEFEFKPTVKWIMSSNNKPIIRGTDKGIWRRIRVIMFNQDFTDRDDKRLIDTLLAEAPRILWWAIEGAIKWYDEGLKTPRHLDDNIKEYRSEMDLIQRWIDESCEIALHYSDRAMDLFKNFCNYITVNKEYQMTNTAFGRNMGRKFLRKVSNGVTIYQGIRLKKSAKYYDI